MGNSFCFRSIFFSNCQSAGIFNKKILFNKNFIRIYLFNMTIRKYAKIFDHNFYFFHQNLLYKNSFFQIPSETCEKTSLADKNVDKIENMILSNSIKNLTKSEIVEIMEWLIGNIDTNPIQSELIWKFLDKKCSDFVNYVSVDESLYIFDMWYILLYRKAFSTKYFTAVMNMCLQNFESLNKIHIMQILYYLGHHKKMVSPKMLEKIKTMESKIFEMSDVEFSTVCLSLFKLKVKSISDIFKERTVNVAKNFMNLNERFHLISVLKFLRQVQHYDQGIYDLLFQYIMKEWSSFNFVECTHFLATFSSQSVYESCLFETLENHATMLLKQEKGSELHESVVSHYHPSLRCRVKDVSRYLWTMVSVGHQVKCDTIEVIVSLVEDRYFMGEYELQPHVLVDFLQSLAIIEVYPFDLIKLTFTEKFLSLLKTTKRDKPLHQLFFLYKSIEIECPDIIKQMKFDTERISRYFKPLPKNLRTQIEKRNLSNVLSLIKQIRETENNVKLCCNLPHIVILGLEVLWNPAKKDGIVPNGPKLFYIEILDTSVCCRNSQQPIGFMKVKLRHLRKLNFSVLVLTETDISILNNMPLHCQSQEFQKMLCNL